VVDVSGRGRTDEGAAEAFRRQYEAHGRALLAYAVRRVERPEDAADVVAEAMLVAWRRRDDAPVGAEARLWLFGVARQVLANHRRGTVRRHRLGERLRRELPAQLAGAASDHSAEVEAHLVVRRAIDRLDEGDREILRLAAWEGLEPHEIAAVMDLPGPTARSRLLRARRRLRRQLEAAGIAPAVATAGDTGPRPDGEEPA
jgi:RNA polymerase sigma factor (sigma-70 family)